MTAVGKSLRRLWVGLRQSSLRKHGQKAASEIPPPGSGRSPLDTNDPKPPVVFVISLAGVASDLPFSDHLIDGLTRPKAVLAQIQVIGIRRNTYVSMAR